MLSTLLMYLTFHHAHRQVLDSLPPQKPFQLIKQAEISLLLLEERVILAAKMIKYHQDNLLIKMTKKIKWARFIIITQ